MLEGSVPLPSTLPLEQCFMFPGFANAESYFSSGNAIIRILPLSYNVTSWYCWIFRVTVLLQGWSSPYYPRKTELYSRGKKENIWSLGEHVGTSLPSYKCNVSSYGNPPCSGKALTSLGCLRELIRKGTWRDWIVLPEFRQFKMCDRREK